MNIDEGIEFDLNNLSEDSETEDDHDANDQYILPDRKTALSIKTFGSQITRLEFEIKTKKKVAVEANTVLDQEEATLNQLQTDFRRCREELEPLVAEVKAHPRGRNGVGKEKVALLDTLQEKYKSLKDRVSHQKKIVEGERQVVLMTERELNIAERELFKVEEQKREVLMHTSADLIQKKAATKSNQKLEKRAAKKIIQRQKAKAKYRQKQSDNAMQNAENQVYQAMEGNQKAVQRVSGTSAFRQKVTQHMHQKAELEYNNRTEAVLQLKADIDTAMNQLKGQNERLATKRQAKDRAHQAEKANLLSQGQNPYAVFRKRDVDAEAAKSERRQRNRIAEKEQELVERLVREDKYLRTQEQRQKRDRAYEQKYRKELGRHVAEARTAEYLKLRTVGNRDIIDPSGKTFKIQPSQETVIKDHSFGLGKNPRKEKGDARLVVDKIRKKKSHRNVELGEFSRLVPKPSHPQLEGSQSKEGQAISAHELEQMSVAEVAVAKALDGLILPDEKPVGAELQETLGLRLIEDDVSVDEEVEELIETSALAETEEAERKAKSKGIGRKKPLSKFEKDCLERAQARQRARLEKGTVQIAAGRVFQGQAFVSKPEEIVFRDFDVDVPRRQKIVITNVSLTFNNFKVLDLADNIKDFFEINYEKPGRMSAGTSCSIEVVFIPRLNQDIFSELKCLAGTGPFSIPIICTTKKVTPVLGMHEVNFQNVVMGEQKMIRLSIKNNGALPTQYRFTLADRNATGAADANSLLPGSLGFSSLGSSPSNSLDRDSHFDSSPHHVQPSEEERQLLQEAAKKGASELQHDKNAGPFQLASTGKIEAYSEVHHLITFAPLSADFFRELYFVTFEGFRDRMEVLFVGQGLKLPIYVAEPITNINCCIYGKMYRKEVIVRNRGKIAMQIQAQVPPELEGFVEFTPSMGYVQPGVDFILQMRFEPKPEIIKSVGRYSISNEGIIAVPVRIFVPEQAIPVYFTLRSQLTRGDIELSHSMIDFGDCYTSQSLFQKVKLKNLSILPQKYGFIQCPQEIEVQPNDGFGILLPKEEIEVLVYFRPLSAVAHTLSLTLRNSFANTYIIRCKGQGLDPPLRISHTILKLAPACPGDKIIESFYMKNTQRQKYFIQFLVPRPEMSCLKVIPTVAAIDPAQELRVEVEFNPHLTYGPPFEPKTSRSASLLKTPSAPSQIISKGSLNLGEENSKSENEKGDRSIKDDDNSVDELQQSEGILQQEEQAPLSETEGQVTYSNFVPFGDGNASIQETNAEKTEPWSRHADWKVLCFIRKDQHSYDDSQTPPPLLVEVQTTTVQRILAVDSPNISFGQLAVGQVKVIPVRLRNYGDVPAPLSAHGLNSTGAFSIVNALRPVAPRSIHKMLLQFAPNDHGIRTEFLTIASPELGKKLLLNLQGEGVSPVLQITPEDGIVDMGHVLQGDTKRQQITLTNTSVFALTFRFQPLNDSPQNYSHLPPFAMIPSQGEIQPGQELSVDILYTPDHERIWPYCQKFLVDVPNQSTAHIISLSGRCWMRQMYCVAQDVKSDIFSSIPEKAEDTLTLPSHLQQLKKDLSEKLGVTPELEQEIFLKFPKPTIEQASEPQNLTIEIGCTIQEELKVGSQGTFEIELDEQARISGYFTFNPDKGSVQPGKSQEVVITFSPPAVSVDGGLDVGQWFRTIAFVNLKGGYRPAGDTDMHVVRVNIEGYIRI